MTRRLIPPSMNLPGSAGDIVFLLPKTPQRARRVLGEGISDSQCYLYAENQMTTVLIPVLTLLHGFAE